MKSLIFSKHFGCKCQYFRYSSLTLCLSSLYGCMGVRQGPGVLKDPKVPNRAGAFIGGFTVFFAVLIFPVPFPKYVGLQGHFQSIVIETDLLYV